MGQMVSILIPVTIGYEVGRRIGLADEVISEISDDPKFVEYQHIMRPNIPCHLKTKLDNSITLMFFMTLLWIFNRNPLIVSTVLTASFYAFGYDFCRSVKENTFGGRVVSLLYKNGSLVVSLIMGK